MSRYSLLLTLVAVFAAFALDTVADVASGQNPPTPDLDCAACHYVYEFVYFWMRGQNQSKAVVEKWVYHSCAVIPDEEKAACEKLTDPSNTETYNFLINSLLHKQASGPSCVQLDSCANSSVPSRRSTQREPPKLARPSLGVATQNCAGMKSLVTKAGLTGAYGVQETMICVAWIESRWECAARNPSSGAAGLWQFMPGVWAGKFGVCPAGVGFFDCQSNANCMAAGVKHEGFNPWSNEPDECANCVWHGNCGWGPLPNYPGCKK